jgi:hypothetical protein
VIRTVYCPSEEKIPEAEELAAKHSLSITVGESESMQGLDFDRNSVSVVYIPTIHLFSMASKSIHKGFTQAFDYMCDFVDFKKSPPSVVISREDGTSDFITVTPSYLESHIARFTTRIEEAGVYSAEIMVDGIKFAETEPFEVTE